MNKYLTVLIAIVFLSACDAEKEHPTREGKAPLTEKSITAGNFEVLSPIPNDWVSTYSINTSYYKKMTVAWGMPIIASEDVDDLILKNAAELLAKQLSDEVVVNAEAVRDKLWQRYFKVAIFPTTPGSGGTKQLPEFSRFAPAAGYGATKELPTMGMSDVNFDYQKINTSAQGNTFSHELTHSIHLIAGSVLPDDFEGDLTKAYESAIALGTWPSGEYINENRLEYLAEGSEIWFGWQPTYASGINRSDLLNIDSNLYSVLSYMYHEEAESFFSGTTSFIQPTFSSVYRYEYEGDDIDKDAVGFTGTILGDGEPIDIYRSALKSENSLIYKFWTPEFIYFSFEDLPFPGSETLNDTYRYNQYQFIIRNDSGEIILNCTMSKENVISEYSISQSLDFNYLNNYCSNNA
ncbi:TPA: hypothetical protein ACN4AY_004610 [Vibrio parahaemolyticus]